MNVLIALCILLLAAATCWGLSRAAPTRVLGGLAALASAIVALLVALQPATVPAPPLTLLVLGEAVFSLGLELAPAARLLAVTGLGAGAAVLLALAGAIAPAVRGFGSLFGWSLLTLAAALLSLLAPPFSLVQPTAWAVLVVCGYGALLASGASADEGPPPQLTFGLLASLLLAGALLAAGPTLAAGEQPAGGAALGALLGVLALTGCPPLLAAREEAQRGPAPLGALIYGLAAPIAGLGWLLRALNDLPVVPTSWAVTLGLVGGLGALACGAGALGERRLRPLLGWAGGAQTALVLAASGVAGPLGALAGPALLLNLLLGSVAGAVAATVVERTSGSDDYTLANEASPRVAGWFWAGAALATLGLPPLWGFWGRLWLLEAVLEQQPWLLAPLLAGAVLLAFALLAPLGRLWAGNAAGGAPARTSWGETLAGLGALAPLLAGGLAPQLAWSAGLDATRFAPATLPVEMVGQAAAGSAGLVLIIAAALLLRAPVGRSETRDPDEQSAWLAPAALGEVLLPLARLARPTPLLAALWAGLQQASAGLRLLVGLFEQRYYLLGVLVALITIMLLMAQ